MPPVSRALTEELDRLVGGAHHDPHSLLGAHPARSKTTIRTLRPDAHDYFVLKPMHSAFYGTTLDVLLQQLGVRTLIVTGVAGNICVLFTANDAYMRGMHVFVPEDCVASNSTRENRYALTQMETVLKAITTPSTRLSLATLKKARAGARQSRTPKR